MQEGKIIIDDYEGGYKILEGQIETLTEATIEVIKIEDVEILLEDEILPLPDDDDQIILDGGRVSRVI